MLKDIECKVDTFADARNLKKHDMLWTKRGFCSMAGYRAGLSDKYYISHNDRMLFVQLHMTDIGWMLALRDSRSWWYCWTFDPDALKVAQSWLRKFRKALKVGDVKRAKQLAGELNEL